MKWCCSVAVRAVSGQQAWSYCRSGAGSEGLGHDQPMARLHTWHRPRRDWRQCDKSFPRCLWSTATMTCPGTLETSFTTSWPISISRRTYGKSRLGARAPGAKRIWLGFVKGWSAVRWSISWWSYIGSERKFDHALKSMARWKDDPNIFLLNLCIVSLVIEVKKGGEKISRVVSFLKG